MLKIVCVLFILGLYKYCHGTETGEWKQHFYQPRRNYSNRTQNESSYQTKASENVQSQVPFTLLKPRKERQIYQSTKTNIGVRHSLTQWRSNDDQNESKSRRRLFRDSFKINTLKQNDGLKNDQDSFRTKIYFRPRNNRNSQLRNSVKVATKQTAKQNGYFQTEYQDSKIFSDCCSVTSNVLFVRNTGSKSVSNGHNSFKGPDYLPPLDETTIMYKAPEYLPPTERPYYPIKKITNHPTKTATNNFSTRATKTPLIPIVNQRPATKQPYCKTCISTSGPFYIPVTKSTLPSVFATNTYKGKEYDPAKAIQVPTEEEEGMVNIIPLPPQNEHADKGISSEEGVELKANIPRNVTTTFRPVDRVKERGDVPGKEESTSVEPTIVIPVTSTLQMIYTSKIAMTTGIPSEEGVELKANMPSNVTTTFHPVDRVNERGDVPGKVESASIEPTIVIPVASDDHSTLTTDVPSTLQMIYTSKIATTTPKMTLMSTNSPITSNKKIPKQTFENDRHLIKESGPTTQTNMRNTVPFKGLEYLPPDITKKTTLIPTTLQSLDPASVMVMPVSPEPEVTSPIPPPTTVTTTTTTTVNTSFMTPRNRYQTEANLPMNTSFSGPEYLPPKEPRIPTATASSGAAPALAMPVPPEPEDITISTSSPPKTSTDAFRAAKSPNTPTDTNFKVPEYLPPKEVIPVLPPSPAMAIPVPKEPDCENDPNNTPNIDPRFADTDSCGKKKPTKPFKGPPYLPPLAKTMVK